MSTEECTRSDEPPIRDIGMSVTYIRFLREYSISCTYRQSIVDPSGGVRVQEVHQPEAPAHPPLLGVQPLRAQDGPPLPLAQQLRRPPQPPPLLPLHGLHRRRLPLHHGLRVRGR